VKARVLYGTGQNDGRHQRHDAFVIESSKQARSWTATGFRCDVQDSEPSIGRRFFDMHGGTIRLDLDGPPSLAAYRRAISPRRKVLGAPTTLTRRRWASKDQTLSRLVEETMTNEAPDATRFSVLLAMEASTKPLKSSLSACILSPQPSCTIQRYLALPLPDLSPVSIKAAVPSAGQAL
jgi:hypothetical protein